MTELHPDPQAVPLALEAIADQAVERGDGMVPTGRRGRTLLRLRFGEGRERRARGASGELRQATQRPVDAARGAVV